MAGSISYRIPKSSSGKYAQTFRIDYPQLQKLIEEEVNASRIKAISNDATSNELRNLFSRIIVPAYKRAAPVSLTNDLSLRDSIRSVALRGGLERELSMDWRLGITINGRGPLPAHAAFRIFLSSGEVIWMHRSPITEGRATTRSHKFTEEQDVRLPGGGTGKMTVPRVDSIDARWRMQWPLRAYYQIRDGGYLTQTAVNIGIKMLDEYLKTYFNGSPDMTPEEYGDLDASYQQASQNNYLKLRRVKAGGGRPFKGSTDIQKIKHAREAARHKRKIQRLTRRYETSVKDKIARRKALERAKNEYQQFLSLTQ